MRFQELLENRNQPDFIKIMGDFLPLAMKELGIDVLPKIKLVAVVDDESQPTFGRFETGANIITLAVLNRHPLDTLRTLAHELVHFRQSIKNQLTADSGTTGSPEENEAHEIAGIIMRNFNKAHPQYFTIRAVELHESKSDHEICNYHKLDGILVKLCELVVAGKKKDAELYGMVAAAVLDPENRLVMGINLPAKDGTRRHAEREAIDNYTDKYGTIPEGSIVLTTCSPCSENMSERYGESCTDLLNRNNVKKVYCGFTDPTQEEEARDFNIMETENQSIRAMCKQFADSFLDLNENFADGKNPGRKGLAKRSGVNTNASVSSLRKTAKNSSGEKARMAHWLANMKAGRKKAGH